MRLPEYGSGSSKAVNRSAVLSFNGVSLHSLKRLCVGDFIGLFFYGGFPSSAIDR